MQTKLFTIDTKSIFLVWISEATKYSEKVEKGLLVK